jgi:hypothetical protein
MSEVDLIILPLTENEIKLIAVIRSLHPFEKVIINADKEGKPDNFLVERSYKVMLSTG